jgi:hypothetical protein
MFLKAHATVLMLLLMSVMPSPQAHAREGALQWGHLVYGIQGALPTPISACGMKAQRDRNQYQFQFASNPDAGFSFQFSLSGIPARIQDGMRWTDSMGRQFHFSRPALMVEETKPLGRLGLEKQITKLVVFVDDEFSRVDAAQLFRYRSRPLLGNDQISEMHCEF